MPAPSDRPVRSQSALSPSRVFALAFVLAASALAGCVSPEPLEDATDVPAPGPIHPIVGEPVIQDHEHDNASAHDLALNFEALGRHNGWADDGTWPSGAGGVNELAVWGDLVVASRGGSLGGFAILDFANVSSPTILGEFRSEPGADIEISADGNWVFLASQRTVPSADNLASKPLTGNLHRGVYVVDATDKASPSFESFFPLPTNGPHTNTYYCMGHVENATCHGRELMLVQTYDLVPNVATGDLLGAVPVTHRIFITEFTTLADGSRGLETLAVWSLPDLAPPGKLYFPHDAVMQKHPITGQELMYVAYWDAGLLILDVTDPSAPRFVSQFLDFKPTALVQLHYAEPFPALVEGRHITAVAPEIVTAEEAGQVTFVDTTDPGNPTYVGYWSIPGGLAVDSPFIFSPHNFDIRCTDSAGGAISDPGANATACRLAIGHNHGGVWEMDASTLALMEEAPTTGYFMPVPEEGCNGRCVGVWGVMYRHDGTLAVSDGPTGIWVIRAT